jgi:hypothetical protein
MPAAPFLYPFEPCSLVYKGEAVTGRAAIRDLVRISFSGLQGRLEATESAFDSFPPCYPGCGHVAPPLRSRPGASARTPRYLLRATEQVHYPQENGGVKRP